MKLIMTCIECRSEEFGKTKIKVGTSPLSRSEGHEKEVWKCSDCGEVHEFVGSFVMKEDDSDDK